MATQSAFTTVTLRRLPQGETIQITISSNLALNILKDKDTGAEVPALSSSNPIILTPRVYGTSGQEAEISEAVWKMDGASVPSAVGSYTNNGILTISGSPIGKVGTSVHPILLSFAAKATLSGHTYDVQKTLVLNCSETSANSYWGAIEASAGTTLDEVTDQTILTARLYLGTAEATGDYTVRWYKTGAGAGGTDKYLSEGKTLTVTRDMVDTSAHFEAHFRVGDNEVEAEGVSIFDLTDDMQIIAEGDTTITENGTASLRVKAYSKNTKKQLSIQSVEVVASDSIRQRTFHKDYITASVEKDGEYNIGRVSMQEQYWRVPFADQQIKGEWAICGESAADDTLATGADENEKLAKATKCEVTLLIGATADL